MPALNLADGDDETMIPELVKSNAIETKERIDANGDDNKLANVTSKLGTFFLSLCIFLLPFFAMSPALAVQSGGRMGGSFSGSSSRSSSSSSRSYSTPSRSYGGSSSYSSGYRRGYSSGLSSGYSRRPSVTVVSPSYYRRPFLSPFSYGYGSPGVVVANPNPFSGLVFFVGFCVLASTLLSTVGSSAADTLNSATSQSVLGPGVSVVELSVALDVPDRDSPNSILSALDRLFRTARTDSRVGLQNLSSQVAMELLRRRDSIVAASSRGKHYRDDSKAQRDFSNLSIEQRGKFQRETVNKFGGVDYSEDRVRALPSAYDSQATSAVVTIIMMIDGDSTSNQLSKRVNSMRDVEGMLRSIAADAKAESCLRGAEILWTPEESNDFLSMKDVYADYPDLRSV